MSKGRSESVLGLVPSTGTSQVPSDGNLLEFSPNRAITRDEQRIQDEYEKQRLVIEATAAKAFFGMTKVGEVNEHGTLTFDETVGYILEIKDRERGKEHQAYVDAFVRQQVPVFGQNIMSIVQTADASIGREIHRSLYPTPEPPEPRSVWKRLFG